MSSPVIQPPQVPGAAPMAPPYQQQMMAGVAVINGNTTGAQTIIASPSSGKAIKVYSVYFTVQSSCTVTFNDGVNSDGALPLGNGGSFVVDVRSNGDPWFQTAAGSGFVLTTSIATPIVGRAYYLAL